MKAEDLAIEMAAARKRRAEKTASQIKAARVYAVRSGLRPGSSREEIEERARSFYPRLGEDLLSEVVAHLCAEHKPEAPAVIEPSPAPAEP